MSIDFLSLLNESNSIKNDDTDEIILTSPLIEIKDQCKITVPCSISSNCNTLIKCEIIEISCSSISFSNLSIEGNLLLLEANNFKIDNCTIRSIKKCAEAIITINTSSDVLITNSKIIDSDYCGIIMNNNSIVKIDKTEIGNISETLLVVGNSSSLTITNSHLHHSK